MKQWLETREVLDFLTRVGEAGQRAALATVVRVRGSAYRHEGAKLVVAGDGSTAGNVSGGCLEQDVRVVALQVIRKAESALRSYCSRADEIGGWSICFGVLVPRPQLVVLGEGDDARPLVRFAADVGFRVVVVDRRPGYLTRERFPGAAALVESAGDELDAVLPLDAECYAVVMNHNFAADQAYVRALMKTPVAYVGTKGRHPCTDRLSCLASRG